MSREERREVAKVVAMWLLALLIYALTEFFWQMNINTHRGKINACMTIFVWFLLMLLLGFVCIGLEV